MPKNPTLRTPEQVKAEFLANGTSLAQWARDNRFPPVAVYQVLNGFTKAHRGQAHNIAVALGIKAAPSKTAA